ncbi:hypothetical protein evm_000188 [Chilo suppressalis]|nr:hypothetical protein evm_000188 [Chilo suppressalis]
MFLLLTIVFVVIPTLCLSQVYIPPSNESTTPRIAITQGREGTLRMYRDPLVTSIDERDHYYPNYGYEPYWTHGQYLIRHPDADLKPGQSTTKMPLVCGEECGYIYTRIKHLCAGKSSKWYLRYCYECYYGHHIVDFTDNYRDFNSYCELLNANCRLPPLNQWGILHLGKCRRPAKNNIYLPLFPNTALLERATEYLAAIEQRLEKADLDLKDWKKGGIRADGSPDAPPSGMVPIGWQHCHVGWQGLSVHQNSCQPFDHQSPQ